jgi:hypothetical protein
MNKEGYYSVVLSLESSVMTVPGFSPSSQDGNGIQIFEFWVQSPSESFSGERISGIPRSCYSKFLQSFYTRKIYTEELVQMVLPHDVGSAQAVG